MINSVYTSAQLKDLLSPIFADNGVKRAVLFGSYGKGEATPSSDIDLFVDSGLSGLDFFGLLEEVVTAVGKDVDLIDAVEVQENSRIGSEIMSTGVVIYEQ
jgi:predicted nucleotidyltransferase